MGGQTVRRSHSTAAWPSDFKSPETHRSRGNYPGSRTVAHAIVAAAGPGANLLMAIFWALVAKIGMILGPSSWAGLPMQYMGIFGIQINAILMILNLLPLPPLDGGRVAVGLLPGPWAWRLSRIEPFGFFILLALLATGILGIIIGPPIHGFEQLISFLVGLR
jgi:Zn-dependent protease